MCGDGKQSLRPVGAGKEPRTAEELREEARALWEKKYGKDGRLK